MRDGGCVVRRKRRVEGKRIAASVAALLPRNDGVLGWALYAFPRGAWERGLIVVLWALAWEIGWELPTQERRQSLRTPKWLMGWRDGAGCIH